jgi:hypothetical protein
MAWRVEDLISSNKECKIDDSVAALFLFGSDGGGEAFAFDTRSTPPPIVVVPFIGMDFQDTKLIARTSTHFCSSCIARSICFDSVGRARCDRLIDLGRSPTRSHHRPHHQIPPQQQ